MKTRLPGNFFPSPLICSICFALFVTASGCASTSELSADTVSLVPVKQGERDLYLAVSKGDHVLVYAKDDRTLDMVVTGISREKQIIVGQLISPKDSDYKPTVDVNFSDIENIEIKKHPSTNNEQSGTASNSGVKNGSCDSTACKGVAYTLYTIIYFGFYPLLFSLVI